VWCKQVKNILKKNFKFSHKLKINDFGCGYFPFYKELKLSNLKHDYFGFDNDKDILTLGIKKFPELKKKYKILDIESLKPIRKANISVVSALLEHLYEPAKVLKYLIKNTKDCLILRIPISKKGSYNFIKKSKKNSAWIFNVFKKKDIVNTLEKNNFNLSFYFDKASQESQIGSNFIKKLKRKIIIVEAKKIENEV
jgi:trans-aconitate methyltransferase